MRITKTALFAIGIFAVSPLVTVGDETHDAADHQLHQTAATEQPLIPQYDVTEVKLDPITTGGSINSDQLSEWKIRSAEYLKCPECVASQPFPEE